MNNIIIFGNGQLAEVVCFYLTHDSPYTVTAFCVDGEYIRETTFMDLPVIPFEDVEQEYSPDDYNMFIALGYRQVNKVRADKYYQAKRKGYDLISYINSKATTWPGLSIGENTFIFENNVIQPFAKIGSNVTLWSGNHIGHHSQIDDHCFLASHIVVSGGVSIGSHTFIGVNATLRDNITIGSGCVIGAGALILNDTPEKAVYPGNGSKSISKKSDQLRAI